MDDKQPTVRAVTASTFDGDTYLVALQDDVDGWEVLLTSPDGRELIADGPFPFEGGYYPALLDKPSWDLEPDLTIRYSWELRVHGVPVNTEGTRAG